MTNDTPRTTRSATKARLPEPIGGIVIYVSDVQTGEILGTRLWTADGNPTTEQVWALFGEDARCRPSTAKALGIPGVYWRTGAGELIVNMIARSDQLAAYAGCLARAGLAKMSSMLPKAVYFVTVGPRWGALADRFMRFQPMTLCELADYFDNFTVDRYPMTERAFERVMEQANRGFEAGAVKRVFAALEANPDCDRAYITPMFENGKLVRHVISSWSLTAQSRPLNAIVRTSSKPFGFRYRHHPSDSFSLWGQPTGKVEKRKNVIRVTEPLSHQARLGDVVVTQVILERPEGDIIREARGFRTIGANDPVPEVKQVANSSRR